MNQIYQGILLSINNKYLVNRNKWNIINKKTQRIMGNKNNGYLLFNVNKKNQYIHRIIYEQFKEKIINNLVIDHIDDNRENNSINNLQLLTRTENIKKSIINKDYSFLKTIKNNKKIIKTINLNNGNITIFPSLYSASKILGINASIIKYVSEKSKN